MENVEPGAMYSPYTTRAYTYIYTFIKLFNESDKSLFF